MGELYDQTLRRLIRYRQLKHMTQMDMGHHFGITQSHYSKMELGRSEISYEILCKLYEMKWDIDYLVTGTAFHGLQDNVLKGLMESCGKNERDTLIKLILWAVEQFVDISADEEIDLEVKIMKMLLEQNDRMYSMMYLVRSVKDFSQISMAERLGVGMKKYRKMEKGYTQPDLKLLTVVYQISNCLPSLFLGGEEGKMVVLNSLWSRIDENLQYELIRFLDFGMKIMGLKK